MAKSATAEVGHNSNGLTDTAYEQLFFVNLHHYNKALAAKKLADAALKNCGKVIKSDLGDYGLTAIKTFLKAQSDEGAEELRAEAEAKAKAMRYAGAPSGYQFDLLEDRTPLFERAAAEGRRAGLLGETLNNPYSEESEAGQAYAEAWTEGQQSLFAGIKAKEDAEADELIKGQDVEDEPFPDAE